MEILMQTLIAGLIITVLLLIREIWKIKKSNKIQENYIGSKIDSIFKTLYCTEYSKQKQGMIVFSNIDTIQENQREIQLAFREIKSRLESKGSIDRLIADFKNHQIEHITYLAPIITTNNKLIKEHNALKDYLQIKEKITKAKPEVLSFVKK